MMDEDESIAVSEQTHALMKKGCTKTLLPPATVTGTQRVETKFILDDIDLGLGDPELGFTHRF